MSNSPLQLWGGIECTLARIGESYRDEVRETGHHDRAGDLDLVARLGIRTLRYPVVWEAVSPDDPQHHDWSWTDARLARIRDLGIAPIAGLMHHGGGPRYTSLLDPDFPRLFAAYAGRVARRYPWIAAYTPVNEPLTTARFSALYGHWHPHRRSEGDFLRALLAQCRATVLAMRAIRRVNPAAQLVQTEDIGRVFSAPDLADQAQYENERRWLSLDLLHGRVDRHHAWWRRFADHGIEADALAIFGDGDGVPDLIGVNHYLTSERFLDGRTGLYPPHLVGGNGRRAYADVEAVRTRLPRAELGPAARLSEVWQRYGRPLAVTEVHHGSTRDEQLRWLAEVWRAAVASRRRGVDVRAVTAWALFGTLDWNSLLVRRDGIYEPGAFDARGDAPRPTALARAVSELARSGRFDHPALDSPGWWLRPGRFYDGAAATQPVLGRRNPRRIVVAGPQDPLADAIVQVARARGLASERQPHDDAAPGSISARRDVWAMIDLVPGPRWRQLASSCRRAGIAYVRFETGRCRAGRDRAEPDRDDALTICTGPLFGPSSATDALRRLAERLVAGDRIGIPEEIVSPTYLPDLAHVVLDLMIDGERGAWNLFSGSIPRAMLATEIARRLDVVARLVPHAGPMLDRSLTTRRAILMPPLHSALDRFVDAIRAQLVGAPPVFDEAA